MRNWVAVGTCLALAACGKPAATHGAAVQAPQEPKVRIAQVGSTAFAHSVMGVGTVARRQAEALPGSSAPVSHAKGQGYVLTLSLPGREAARVALGATAQVTFAAFNNDTIVGRVVAVGRHSGKPGPAAIEITLPTDSRLREGIAGSAQILEQGAGTRALAVPPSALFDRQEAAASVFVVDLATSRLHLRKVTLGGETPAGITVTAGLAIGEWVALSRTDQLKDGMKIAAVGPDS